MIEASADEIAGFATGCDPQPFHVAPKAAERSSFGGRRGGKSLGDETRLRDRDPAQ